MRIKNILGIVTMFLITLFSVSLVAGIPTGPSTITPLGSSSYPSTSAANISAIAGNVSEIDFVANSVTHTFQGYFGNISGSIVLGNSDNQSLYDWTSATPSGEIYATRDPATPVWSAIKCANQSQIDLEDVALNADGSLDQDSINKTFLNTTSFNQFYVGGVIINDTQNCHAVNLNNETGTPNIDFSEVVLSDTNITIYTAVINQNTLGFDNRTHDFQLIVGEDGHNGDSASTPYYFYVELG